MVITILNTFVPHVVCELTGADALDDAVHDETSGNAAGTEEHLVVEDLAHDYPNAGARDGFVQVVVPEVAEESRSQAVCCAHVQGAPEVTTVNRKQSDIPTVFGKRTAPTTTMAIFDPPVLAPLVLLLQEVTEARQEEGQRQVRRQQVTLKQAGQDLHDTCVRRSSTPGGSHQATVPRHVVPLLLSGWFRNCK